MSAASSKQPGKLDRLRAELIKRRGWGPVEAVILTFLAYKVPAWLVADMSPFILPLLPFTKNVQSFVLYGLFETLVLFSVYVIVRFYGLGWRNLGLGKWRPSFIGLAIIGFCAYYVLSIMVRFFVEQLIKIPDQEQPLGFVSPTAPELVLVFMMLVLLVPFVEEALFRGFLYKGVRSRFSFVVAAAVVSVLFALAHGQLDVALDVFALSMVLCYMRETTGSIWPGIMLHAIKNLIAFLLKFVYNLS